MRFPIQSDPAPGAKFPRRAAIYFGGAAPDRLPVASADDPLLVS
jgi:hypothetical protein